MKIRQAFLHNIFTDGVTFQIKSMTCDKRTFNNRIGFIVINKIVKISQTPGIGAPFSPHPLKTDTF